MKRNLTVSKRPNVQNKPNISELLYFKFKNYDFATNASYKI